MQREAADLTSDENASVSKNNNAFLMSIRNYSNWRQLRESQDKRAELRKISNPASDHEHYLWKATDLHDINLRDFLDFPPGDASFEDFLGNHSLLGKDLDQASLPEQVSECHHVKKNL